MQPGETAAPLPEGPQPITCTGTAAMRRVHRFFLWAYDEAPGLVRSVTAGDIVGRGMYRKQYVTLFPGRPIAETL